MPKNKTTITLAALAFGTAAAALASPTLTLLHNAEDIIQVLPHAHTASGFIHLSRGDSGKVSKLDSKDRRHNPEHDRG